MIVDLLFGFIIYYIKDPKNSWQNSLAALWDVAQSKMSELVESTYVLAQQQSLARLL